SRRRHTRSKRDWSSDVCSSDLSIVIAIIGICLLLISNVLTGSNNKTTDVIKESNQEQSAVETSAGTNKDETVMKLEKTYEADLEKMLEKIKGISKVEVMVNRSEEHTSELQSRFDLVCRLLLEKKKKKNT